MQNSAFFEENKFAKNSPKRFIIFRLNCPGRSPSRPPDAGHQRRGPEALLSVHHPGGEDLAADEPRGAHRHGGPAAAPPGVRGRYHHNHEGTVSKDHGYLRAYRGEKKLIYVCTASHPMSRNQI